MLKHKSNYAKIDDMNIVIRYLLIACILLVLSFTFAEKIDATDIQFNYIIIEARYTWTRYEELPFNQISQMCWNRYIGWCDEEIILGDIGFVRAEIVDFNTQQYGIIVELNESDNPSKKCYFFLFRPNYGVDGNPHPTDYYWIDCQWR